jgi:hypothetical protein
MGPRVRTCRQARTSAVGAAGIRLGETESCVDAARKQYPQPAIGLRGQARWRHELARLVRYQGATLYELP